MLRRRTSILIAAAALAVGAGAGAGGYALAGSDHDTTAVRDRPAPASTPTAATKELSVGSVYRSARDGVVEVTSTSRSRADGVPFPFGDQGPSRESRAEGSGFVYDGDGHIVTNYHVISGASAISVTFADGSKYKATVVGSDRSSDLAVLKVDAPASKLHRLALGNSSALSVGDGVVAIGSPFGLEETVTSGIVSALNRTIGSASSYSISGVIQTDAAINHGNSGGPLLNLRGQVIGVNTQIESESGGNDGIGFAIPSDTVRSVVSQLLSGQKVEHAFLGAVVETPASRSGAELARVQSGAPAADAGLKGGDVITSFDGRKVASADDLIGAVSAKKPGDKVSVTYARGGSTHTATVTLGNRGS